MAMKLEIDHRKIPREFYSVFCKVLFMNLCKAIKENINPKKYKIRENAILSSSVIRWNKKPPRTIDLVYYITHCLELVYVKGNYIIRLNESKRIPGSSTKVSTLIRLLEFGNEKIPAYPYIRRYIQIYMDSYNEVIKKRGMTK